MRGLTLIIIAAAGVLNLSLFLIVFLQGKRTLHSSWFAITALFSALLCFANLFLRVFDSALFFDATYALGMLVVTNGLIWTLYFVFDEVKKIYVFLLELIGILVACLAFMPQGFMDNFEKISELSYKTEAGIFFYIYLLVEVVLFITMVFILVRAYRYEKHITVKKMQLRYVLIGVIGYGFIATMAGVIAPVLKLRGYAFLDSPASLIWTGAIAYTIFKHHLFNIKVIAAEMLTFIIWFVLFIQTLLAKNIEGVIINGSLLIFVIIFGIFLIRGVIHEIEQREKFEVLNKKLGKANERLQELDQMKSRFLSFASHQVKTPMTAIKGYACLIYYNVDRLPKTKVKQMAGKIKLATDRTISLVNNLLDLRKIEEGRMQYNFEAVSFAQVVRDVVEELRSIAQEKGLYFVFEAPAFEGEAQIDIQKMREVLQNLVENAIKYTDKGWVRLSVKQGGDMDIVFSVKDSGRGISVNVLPQLFKEYERGSAVETAIQGSGLGLFIAKQIVVDHGGKIWAESAGDQKGSAFFVQLPLVHE
ncbi:MAG: ATP-binding protein [bacterium]